MSWKRYFEFAARIRVSSGFLIAAVYVVFCRPAAAAFMAGATIALLGIVLRGYAAGHLDKNRQLATSGPYGYTRNPLYLGSALVAAGFAVAGRVWWLGLLFAVFLGALYLPVIWEEEAHLAKLFPEFHAYATTVPRFLPLPGSHRAAHAPEAAFYSAASTRFHWALYWKNQEYNAFLGYLSGLALLVWKMR